MTQEIYFFIQEINGGGIKAKNKVSVIIGHHQIYHSLLANRTPLEIKNFLLENFWNSLVTDIFMECRDPVISEIEKRIIKDNKSVGSPRREKAEWHYRNLFFQKSPEEAMEQLNNEFWGKKYKFKLILPE
jgi:hypothetical protein